MRRREVGLRGRGTRARWRGEQLEGLVVFGHRRRVGRRRGGGRLLERLFQKDEGEDPLFTRPNRLSQRCPHSFEWTCTYSTYRDATRETAREEKWVFLQENRLSEKRRDSFSWVREIPAYGRSYNGSDDPSKTVYGEG